MVVGDSEFKQKLGERGTTKEEKSMSDEEICEHITEQFDINLRQFLSPNGWEEKRLRRKIIVHLIEEVGLKPQRIAQLCNISRGTINRVLRKNAQNVLPVTG
jgi:DNA invertase Pin-like site-specific DNA recombinase